ncbi:MAG TPA: GatB/YqeY domain-containing protein [Pseudomonadales bacterium]
MADLKARILDETKTAMKARDKARVGALRLMSADVQRVEVDERRTLSDEDVLGVLNRMLKQRRDSLAQFEAAGREDLAAQERFEIEVIEGFMPAAMADAEIEALVERVVGETGAAGRQDMGKVMAAVKAAISGRADMAVVSAKVKARLG